MVFSDLKSLIIPEGEVAQITVDGIVIWEEPASYKNWVKYSTEADGSTIYNGGLGYKDGYRVRSNGELGDVNTDHIEDGKTYHSVAIGFIPVQPGDVLGFKGALWSLNHAANTMNFGYIRDGVYTSVGSFTTQPAGYGICNGNIPVVATNGEVYSVTVPTNSSITHMRMSCWVISGANLIVTVNEEITDGTGTIEA